MVVVSSNMLKVIIVDLKVVPEHETVIALLLVERHTQNNQFEVAGRSVVVQVHHVQVAATVCSSITPVLSCRDVKVVVPIVHQVVVGVSWRCVQNRVPVLSELDHVEGIPRCCADFLVELVTLDDCQVHVQFYVQRCEGVNRSSDPL